MHGDTHHPAAAARRLREVAARIEAADDSGAGFEVRGLWRLRVVSLAVATDVPVCAVIGPRWHDVIDRVIDWGLDGLSIRIGSGTWERLA